MAQHGVTYKINLEVAKLDRSSLQSALDKAIQGTPLKLTNLSISHKKLQEALNAAVTNSPVNITKLAVTKGGLTSLQSSLNKSDLTVKIKKIDATPAMGALKKQLETMLSGLGITGVRDFVNSTTSNGNSNAQNAQDMERAAAAAQVADASLKSSLSTVESLRKVVASLVQDTTKQQEMLDRIKALEDEITNARTKQGEERKGAAQNIAQETAELQTQVTLEKQSQAEATKRQAAAQRELEAAEKRRQKEEEIYNSVRVQTQLTIQRNNFERQITTWIQNNANAYEQNKAEVDAILASLQGMNGEVSEQKDLLAILRARWSEIQKEVAGAQTNASGFKKALNLTNEVQQLLGMTSAAMALRKTLREMFEEVKAVDAAMVEFRKVTDLSESQYATFLEDAAESARDVGTGLSDILNASADFARLGFNADEAATLAQYALVYKNVGDGITDISFATESMISTMKAFGITAEESIHIIDSFNEVGKKSCPYP